MFYSKNMKNMLVVKTFDDTNLIVKKTSSCIISSIHSGHGVLSWRLIYRGNCDNECNKDLKNHIPRIPIKVQGGTFKDGRDWQRLTVSSLNLCCFILMKSQRVQYGDSVIFESGTLPKFEEWLT